MQYKLPRMQLWTTMRRLPPFNIPTSWACLRPNISTTLSWLKSLPHACRYSVTCSIYYLIRIDAEICRTICSKTFDTWLLSRHELVYTIQAPLQWNEKIPAQPTLMSGNKCPLSTTWTHHSPPISAGLLTCYCLKGWASWGQSAGK